MTPVQYTSPEDLQAIVDLLVEHIRTTGDRSPKTLIYYVRDTFECSMHDAMKARHIAIQILDRR